MSADTYNKAEVIGSQGQYHQDMDYSYFGTAQQPYQFLDLPPTPAHTNVVNSDGFSNSSPPDAFDQFQNFDAYNHFNANDIAEPPTPQSQHRTLIAPITSDALDGSAEMNYGEARQGSNSDDEDMTPAQSRRKAQNRAAQRAFRERKERHVKELEAQVAALKAASNSATAENELLKLSLQKISTENEILKATSAHSSTHNSSPTPLPDAGPMLYSPKDFYTSVLHAHDNKVPSHRVVVDADGGRLLAAGATWDFIIKSDQFKRGLVDIAAVSERLRTRAKCDGQGPVFEERAIIEAIEQSVASGSDELM